MNFTSGLKSSNTDNWATPGYLFDMLNKEFGFTLDVCANKDNAKCLKFYDQETNGLTQDWTNDVCWMNPPYGRTIGQWVKKAAETAMGGGHSRSAASCTDRYALVDRMGNESIRA